MSAEELGTTEATSEAAILCFTGSSWTFTLSPWS